MEGEIRQRVAAYKEATEPVPPLVRAGVTDRSRSFRKQNQKI